MERSLPIRYFIYYLVLIIGLSSAQERWNYSAEVIESTKINGEEVRRSNENVRFVKVGKVILTDNAVQYIKDDVLHLNGNTMMINGLDTLTCDSMVYWSKLDSGYAMGNVRYIQPEKDRLLTTDIFHYWQTDGYRGSSFFAKGYTRIVEPNRLIAANEIHYDDNIQLMTLSENASVEDQTRGIFGDEMEIQYADSLLEMIHVDKNAFAYNELNLKINKDGLYQNFRDEMTSKELIAHFQGDHISLLKLNKMATTLYHVVDDSLLAGENTVSGDTIRISFQDGEIKRLQVQGGAIGEFNPEGKNTRLDTTVFYGGEYIDYHIDEQLSFLSEGAFMEYEGTKLSAGEILVNWETNILDAVLANEEYPTVQTKGESPMKGESMVFDLVAKHGRITKGKTSLNQGFYHGKEVFRDDPNVFHVQSSKYTSCDLDNPHFYLGSRKMKMLPGDRVIAKPLWLHIYDVPIIGLPLAVFPNKGGRRQSGWIMPSFDSYKSIGTGFRNFGYYWAPNEYMDEKILVNFFDEQGIHLSSKFNYKKRSGTRWYNFQYNGKISGTIKRRIITNEIIDLADEQNVREDQRLSWSHSQKFDPTQRLAIKYEYVSNKDAYQNDQEVNLQNRLKQNLSSSLNYSKNWKTSSASLGFNQFRDLSIENRTPDSFSYLSDGRYKSYKYEDGPKFNFRLGSRKIFGVGDSWYNSVTSSYTMKTSMGRRDHSLIKESDSTWAFGDTTKLKYGGIKHSASVSAPQTFFKWLTLNPNVSFREDWIFNYKMENDEGEEIDVLDEFKRRLTWNYSLSVKTKIYGLFPFRIGKLNAIRHVITPSLSYQYQPDFSDPQFGGDLYFQNNGTDEAFDYFKGSYVGSTSKTEKKSYRLSVDNVFQAKIKDEKGGYDKSNFLTWNSSISYNTLKDSLKLSEMTSNVRVKSLSGSELFRVRMYHNFYELGGNEGEDDRKPIDQMLNIWGGELPRLTRMSISTDMKFKLFGSAIGSQLQNAEADSTEDIEDEFYSMEKQSNSKKKGNNIWESKLQFKYSANWKHTDDDWDYKFSMKMVNSINLSKKWTLSYMADFNLKEREMTYHSFRIYRPLHCWEFSFNYWPRGNSSGFSLQINVKNPELKDIKLTSKDGKRGFGGF